MKLKKIINIYGGPGVGKSTLAAGLFHNMKIAGFNVEYVTEYAKDLVYEDRLNVLSDDQLYIFAKQHRKILRLKDTVEYIVTDSPLLFSIAYNRMNVNSIYDSDSFEDLVLSVYKQYPSQDLFLIRKENIKYETHGRTQTYNEALLVDSSIFSILQSLGINIVPAFNEEGLISEIIQQNNT